MGYYFSGFVGPYFECKNPVKEVLVDYKTCEKDNCKVGSISRHSTDKFCSDCGGKIIKKTVPHKRPSVNGWDVSEALEEALHRVGVEDGSSVHYWKSNFDDGIGKDFEKQHVAIHFDEGRIEADIRAFKDKHADSWSILNNYYGEENVVIRWGVLTDYV